MEERTLNVGLGAVMRTPGIDPFGALYFFFTPFSTHCVLNFSTVLVMDEKNTKLRTTLNDGYLGSRNDEERSEMRYVMRIAEFSESSNL